MEAGENCLLEPSQIPLPWTNTNDLNSTISAVSPLHFAIQNLASSLFSTGVSYIVITYLGVLQEGFLLAACT